jgi:hypothetical protein
MSKLLTVGRIEGAFAREAALRVAKECRAIPTTWFGRAKTDLVPWFNCPQTINAWDFLNDASIALFLEHAAELEGIPVESRLGGSRWPHLPDYQETYWLPLDFPTVRVFKASDGWPVAIASATGLLRDLEALKAASSRGLGERVAAPDPSARRPMSVDDTLRWIWCCLSQAASVAIENNAPVATFP